MNRAKTSQQVFVCQVCNRSIAENRTGLTWNVKKCNNCRLARTTGRDRAGSPSDHAAADRKARPDYCCFFCRLISGLLRKEPDARQKVSNRSAPLRFFRDRSENYPHGVVFGKSFARSDHVCGLLAHGCVAHNLRTKYRT